EALALLPLPLLALLAQSLLATQPLAAPADLLALLAALSPLSSLPPLALALLLSVGVVIELLLPADDGRYLLYHLHHLLPLLSLLALALLLAEGVVIELLLPADDVPHLVHHLNHLLPLLALLAHHAAGLQGLHQLAELVEHLLRHLAGALAGHVFQLIEHSLEILRPHHLVGIEALGHLHLLALGLLRKLLQELCHGLPQLLHEPRDLLVGRAFLQSLGELVLDFAQTPLGIGQCATVLDAQCDVPQLLDGTAHRISRAVARQPVIDGPQAQVDVL